MSDSEHVPLRDLVKFYIGGGWGEETENDSFSERAYVIRGTDFDAAARGSVGSVPCRWHKPSNLKKRGLRAGDICLEVSGGSYDQPVGRVSRISDYTLSWFDAPVMCASFCKLVRPDEAKVDPFYLFLILDLAYQQRIVERYQVQSTGIRNFQFEFFLDDFSVPLPERGEQEEIVRGIGSFDVRIEAQGRLNECLREVRDRLLPRVVAGMLELPRSEHAE